MDVVIKNKMFIVTVSSFGAEMQSIQDIEGTEFLWNGNPAYWSGRAPNLFPYIGRLTNETYTLNGKQYNMGIHGFAAKTEFLLEGETENSATFLLRSNGSIRKMYPYYFELRVAYRLEGPHISIRYSVSNIDRSPMYFGIGGHPGFSLPFEKGLTFEDYYLEFDEVCLPVHIGFSENCFLTGDDKPFFLTGGNKLMIKHDLFDHDAIVLENMAKGVTLKSLYGKKELHVTYPQMRYLGLWHAPCTSAPYICIEPWTSLPSRQGVIEELTQQGNLVMLPEGEVYQNEWAIELISANY